ncbi:MAG: phytoene/squalene synthase family protein [Phycisphaerales bacterium]|nr:MAG: phytoene/squalene synthase family protein [Phycisphaerales bacterium]
MSSVARTDRNAPRATPAPAGGPADARLTRAREVCRDITKREAGNFYWGLRLTPEPRRSALYAIYAWMRRADDEADGAAPVEERRALLRSRRATLDKLRRAGAQPPDDPVWLVLHDTLTRYDIGVAPFEAMLDGLEEDLDHTPYETRDDLARYCRRVASTVGVACVSVWGLRDGVARDEALGLAERRGVGFQITNILRDIAEDLGRGRVYIPSSDLRAHDLTADDLRAWKHPERCAELVRSLCAWARAEYQASAPLDTMIDPACLPTLRAMTSIYAGLLDRIERDPQRVVRERVRLSKARKLTIAIGAVAGAKLGAGRSGAGAPAGREGA